MCSTMRKSDWSHDWLNTLKQPRAKGGLTGSGVQQFGDAKISSREFKVEALPGRAVRIAGPRFSTKVLLSKAYNKDNKLFPVNGSVEGDTDTLRLESCNSCKRTCSSIL